MPELPEVETMRRGILPILGRTIAEVWRPKTRCQPIAIVPSLDKLRRQVVGRTVAALGRAGKRVVLELDAGSRIIIEPRMTGRVLLAEPPDRDHLRIVFDFAGSDPPRLSFWDSRGLGVVRLCTPEEFAKQLACLGPDALEIDAATLRERLAESRRPIKVALMDQQALAGVGNLYASEILHLAKLHPGTPCNVLAAADWRRVHAAMRAVLAEAVELQGSTLSDGMYANAENAAGSYQDRHRVYQRHGERCLQCRRGTVERIVQAQRSTFFCPRCQRARK